MIMDAVEDVGEPGLRIEPVHLGGFDERHGPGQRFATAIGAREEPVLPPDADRAHGALGRVVVDADAAVFEEELEGGPAAEAVADGLGEIALTRNAQQLGLGPGLEGNHHGARVLLARGLSQSGGLTGDLALDIVDLADPVEGLPRYFGLRALPDIVEVATQVRPACCFSELAAAIRTRCVERVEAGIGIRLEDAPQLTPPVINVLPPHIMPPCDIGHRPAVDADLFDDGQLLLDRPPAAPFGACEHLVSHENLRLRGHRK